MNLSSGFIIRIGEHWGESSLAWAMRRLAYRGAFRTVFNAPGVDVLAFGEVKTCRTEEGALIFAAGPGQEEGDLASEAYAGGEWSEKAAHIWSEDFLLAIDPGRRRIHILLGEFNNPRFHFARRGRSFFLVPDVKAFSNVRPEEIRSPVSGLRMTMTFEGETVASETLEYPWPVADPPMSYDAAVRKTRELMETSLDRTLEKIEEPFAVSFSGGVDSSILVHMLARRNVPIHAFCVWFDDETGRIPEDLGYAREVAGDLGIELNELRIEAREIPHLVLTSVYYGESMTRHGIESGLYYPALLRAMRERGFRIRMSGDGCDNIFAGYNFYAEYDSPDEFRARYLKIARYIGGASILRFQALYGVDLYEPFISRELMEFGLEQPQNYLIEKKDGRFLGKCLVRDAFRGDVPDSILDRPKAIPYDASGTGRLLRRTFSGTRGRARMIRKARARLLKPPNLRFAPPWAVRLGLFDGRMRRRLNKEIWEP